MPARLSRNGASTLVTEEARTLPVAREADVVILGGGVAGLAAALGGRRDRQQRAADRAR